MSQARGMNGMLVTGYPRNMRDVVQYLAVVSRWDWKIIESAAESVGLIRSISVDCGLFSEQVQRIDGVILLDWSDTSLERQVRLGAQLGDIDGELARLELNNYRANMIPIAHFFDQQGYLHLVAGQRAPAEIFQDLAEEIGGILAYPSGSFRAPDVDQETRAVVHSPAESNRRISVDSVDQMIEEEIQNIDLPSSADMVRMNHTTGNGIRQPTASIVSESIPKEDAADGQLYPPGNSSSWFARAAHAAPSQSVEWLCLTFFKNNNCFYFFQQNAVF